MICAIIPARKSSKRIFKKNVVELAGKPLIQHTIDFCNDSDIFHEAFISTDCSEIASLANEKVKAPFLRPKKLASDHSIDKDWLLHFVQWLRLQNKKYTHVMILRPTSPIRPLSLVRKAAMRALKEGAALRSVSKVPKKMAPEWMIVGNQKQFGTEFKKDGFQLRSQDLHDYYYPNGLFDIVSIFDLLETGRLYGCSFLIQEVPEFLVNDIDTIEDLQFIEKNWNNLSKRAEEL